MADGETETGRPEVCGALVTYRRAHLLPVMLDALADQSVHLAHVVVVDNDPEESARAVVEERSIAYIAAGANLGPAGGLRLCVDALADAGHEWVMFLDDDDPPPGPEIVESMVDFLADAVAADPNCAAVGAAGALFDRRWGRSRRPDMSSSDRRLLVDWIGSGMFPIYRVADLVAVGAPDGDLFWGFEDLDIGLRLRAADKTLYRDRDYAIRRPYDHPPKAVVGAAATWRVYYATRNLVAIIRRDGSRCGAAVVGARSMAGAFVRSPGRRLAVARAAARGWRDGQRGVTGRVDIPGGP